MPHDRVLCIATFVSPLPQLIPLPGHIGHDSHQRSLRNPRQPHRCLMPQEQRDARHAAMLYSRTYFASGRGTFSFWPTFNRSTFVPGLASARSLTVTPRSWAILAAVSPFDTVMTSGIRGDCAELVTPGVCTALGSTARAGFDSTG